MSLALKLYEELTEAADDRERFRLIVDAIGALEEERSRSADSARTTDLHQTELRLRRGDRADAVRPSGSSVPSVPWWR